MNIQLKKLHLLIQHFVILQLRHTTFITQSLKEIHSGRETGLIDTGPLSPAETLYSTHYLFVIYFFHVPHILNSCGINFGNVFKRLRP